MRVRVRRSAAPDASMFQSADLFVLGEPTNALDVPTLEVREDSLVELPGAVVLVTHDRFLFEGVATTVLALAGNAAAVGNRTGRACAGREAASRTHAGACIHAGEAAHLARVGSDGNGDPRRGRDARALQSDGERPGDRDMRADELAARCRELQECTTPSIVSTRGGRSSTRNEVEAVSPRSARVARIRRGVPPVLGRGVAWVRERNAWAGTQCPPT